MKIGVIGSVSTILAVQNTLLASQLDIQIIYKDVEFFGTIPQCVTELQDEVQAILFSSQSTYNYAKTRVKSTIPWTFLPYNRASVQEALLKASTHFKSDLKTISVDQYSVQIIEEVLADIGVENADVIQVSKSYKQADFEKYITDYHIINYNTKNASICLTNIEHIANSLDEKNIPCVKIIPSREIILEQLYHLQTVCNARKESSKQFALIIVQFDYIFDNEPDHSMREWQKMRYQNQFREMIYTISQQLDGAVFPDGTDRLIVATHKKMLIDVFLKTSMHHNLLAFGRRSKYFKIWVGSGIGSTMLEARSNSATALNHALSDTVNNSYLMVDNSPTAIVLQDRIDSDDAQYDLEYFAHTLHISSDTLAKLAKITDSTTVLDISKHLNITTRSTNRLIIKLEDQGLVTVVGKVSSKGGRPSRLLKINLPRT